jgi:hypothetical protein
MTLAGILLEKKDVVLLFSQVILTLAMGSNIHTLENIDGFGKSMDTNLAPKLVEINLLI